MSDNEDDPYRHLTEEEKLDLPDGWWHCYLIDPIKRGDLPAIQRYLARNPEGLYHEIPNYFDPFIVAARQPEPAALRLLLQHWALHPSTRDPPPNERGDPLFSVACKHGALETVRYLLNEQPALAHLHDRDPRGHTAILEAAMSLVSCASDEKSEKIDLVFDAQAARERVHRSEALVSLLLDRGACARDSIVSDTRRDNDPDEGSIDGFRDTVLSLAVTRAGPALLRRLIDEGADAFAITTDRSYDLFGWYGNSKTSRNLTLLHIAAFYGNYPGIQVLLEHYAHHGLDIADAVTCHDQLGWLPIHYAVAGWPGELCAARHGPGSNSIDTHPGADIAETDTNTNDTDTDADIMALLRILTDSGNPRLSNAPDQHGETPLHYAVSPNLITHRAAIAVARFLCTDLHASARVRGRGGEAPLHRLWHRRPHQAISNVGTRLAALLLDLDEEDRAADLHAADDAGNTPLHIAARYLENVLATSFLLGRGADVRTRNKRGRTPVHEAAGGNLGLVTVSVEESIRAQEAMLAALCGSAEEGLTLEKNWSALMDEEDVDGRTPRQIAEETRAAWREDVVKRERIRERGRERGRGRGG